MDTVLERLAPGSRVAVVRLRSLGDCVLTTPALALLKKARPDLQIAVVVQQAFAPIFAGNPDVAAILPPSAAELAAWRPVLTVNLHGGATSLRLTLASRSRFRAGFRHFRFRLLYNIRIPRAQEILKINRRVHTAEHLASAMFYLGVPPSEIPRARLYASKPAGESTYAVLHPKASAEDKTWPAAKFLQTAEHLQKHLGIEPVFIAGPGESLEEFGRHRTVVGASLENTKALLAGASLFIGNDSGPAHMAAAFGLPTVVLFGSSDVEIWRPWRTESAVLTHASGIHSIDCSEVFQAVEKLALPQPK